MRARISLAALVLVGFSASAFAGEKQATPPKRPPVVEGSPETWVAKVRFDATGVITDAGPHVQMLCTTAMGKLGAPASQTAGGGSSVMMALTPEEARELAESLISWADSPTDTQIFLRVR